MLGVISVIMVIFAILTIIFFIGANINKTDEEKEQEDYEQMKFLSEMDKRK